MVEQNLTLVGLTEDRTRLILVSASGQEFSLRVDAKLRAALRGEAARLGQLEIQMDSALRPRDIQARIRAGEAPESVAVAAQTTVERIMAYATPVLAERAHVADRAQRASVRRRTGEGPTGLLGDAVAERLQARNVDPATVAWDAWRREDGRWTLVADYLSGESQRHAEFVFDGPGRYVVAEDDEARWLVGEPTTRKGPQPRTGSPTGRRLAAVGSDEDELPLGSDAIDLVSEQPDGPAVESVPDSDEETTEDLTLVSEAAGAAASPEAEAQEAEVTDEVEDVDEVEEPTSRPTRKTRGRASVPSWDEIMFGGGKRE